MSDPRVDARDAGLGRLGRLTGWIAAGALAATGAVAAVAAVTLMVRKELLLPVLLIPVQVPVLLATVKTTEAVLGGGSFAEVSHWLKLLAAADVIYLVIAMLTFDYVLEG
jgi:heme exporter protein B